MDSLSFREGEPVNVPVVIVGGGPVGLALAGDLGWRGVHCLVIEQGDGRIDQPRMDLVGVRTMEHARRWGIVDWVESSPYPRDYPQDCVYVASLSSYEFEREPFPTLADERPPEQSPQKRERCPQDMFDPILARFALSQETVRISYGTEFLTLRETAENVEVMVRDVETGQERKLTASYVVGADGASSKVRKSLGIDMTGEPVLTRTTNVIFRCPNLVDLHDKGKAYRFICIGPEGTYATLVAINGADKWRLSIIGDRNARNPTDHDIHHMIVRVVGLDFDYEVISVLPWVRQELVADQYGSSRVFLAGDSAHVMSPTGGFGMNTGIGDAVDLSWKIEGTLAGWGGAGLLASYEPERKPVAERNSAEASRNLRRMLAPRLQPPPGEAFEPQGEDVRRAYGRWFRGLMANEWFSIGIHLGYRYSSSPICWFDGAPNVPDDLATRYVQTSSPGSRAPHVWIDRDRSTLDLFGRGFVLLRLGGSRPRVDQLMSAAAKRGMPLQVVDVDSLEVLRVYDRPLVLVRPDGHVAWRGDSEPEHASLLIDRVVGATANGARAGTQGLTRQGSTRIGGTAS